MQIYTNPFLILERGDDLPSLAIDRRGERYRVAMNGQALYAVNSCVPIVKVGGAVLGIAKIEEIQTSVSKSNIVMTYVTFSLIQISKDYQKAFRMLYQMQSNFYYDTDDIYSNVDATVPGAISPEQLENITGLANPKAKTPTKQYREDSLSNLPSARDMFGRERKDDDSESDRNRRKNLFCDI